MPGEFRRVPGEFDGGRLLGTEGAMVKKKGGGGGGGVDRGGDGQGLAGDGQRPPVVASCSSRRGGYERTTLLFSFIIWQLLSNHGLTRFKRFV